MKKLILATLFIGISFAAFSQSKSVDELYQKYKGDSDFFHMDIGGNFMNFANGLNIKLDEAKTEGLIKSLEKVRFFKLPKNDSKSKAEFQSLQKSLGREKYELMMESSAKGSGVVILTKGNSKIKDVVVLLNDKSGDFIVLELLGDFDAKSLADASKNIK